MVFDGHAYRILVVSSSEKFNDALRPLLADPRYDHVTFVSSVAAAKRRSLENTYDFVIINAPLPDEFGTKLAIDLSTGKNTVCLLMVRSEVFAEIHGKASAHGVFTLAKPTSSLMMMQGLRWMESARERLRNLEKKTVSIQEKMEEIRLVNRAKWLLIDNLKMSEPDAHRYIEKQAMDRCVTRREIAETILRTYRA